VLVKLFRKRRKRKLEG